MTLSLTGEGGERPKVYVVLEWWPYDGSQTHSIHASREGAEAARTALMNPAREAWEDEYDAENPQYVEAWRLSISPDLPDTFEKFYPNNPTREPADFLTIKEHELLP